MNYIVESVGISFPIGLADVETFKSMLEIFACHRRIRCRCRRVIATETRRTFPKVVDITGCKLQNFTKIEEAGTNHTRRSWG
jgi:hypothetical protein